MTWQLGPLVEKTDDFEMRVARRRGLAGSHFAGKRLEPLRGGPPWIPVLDAGDGWFVTELDFSAGLDAVAEVVVGDDAQEPIPPQVLAAAGSVLARTGGELRLDWRGALRARPLARRSSETAVELIERLAPGALVPAGPAWDDVRVAAFLIPWLEGHLYRLFESHQVAEAWIERGAELPQIEARLVAHPEDDGTWRVLADALLERGHPRGELMALQTATTDPTATRNLLRKHPWLLPLAGAHKRLYLERGFVSRLDHEGGLPHLMLLLGHPALRFLRTLYSPLLARQLPDFLRALEAVGHRSVREVLLPNVKSAERYFPRLKAVFPRLERVGMSS